MRTLSAPSVKISPKEFTFNAACMRLMPDVGCVQFLYNFKLGHLLAAECGKSDNDKVPWRINCSGSKIREKRMRWPKFYKLICDGMNWLQGNDYTIPASLQEYDGRQAVLFDLGGLKEDNPLWDVKLNDLQLISVDAEPFVTFRFAERGDCSLILTFIRSLAEYENMLDRVIATESLLEDWLFEKHVGEVIFTVEDGREVGFALFFPNFSTFLGQAGLYIEDLFVLPESRKRGIGTAILRELAAIAVGRGYGRMDWQCLNWNTPSIEFYCSLGAEPQSDWTTYRMSGDKLNKLAHNE